MEPSADLKMENIGVSGFDNEKPNHDHREIIVRLADLGSSTSLSLEAPELGPLS